MALGSFALLTGCSGSPAPPGKTGDDRAGASISAPARDTGALFQTDSLSYTLRYDGEFYETTIGVRFSNKTRATTYFENCDGQTSVALEKLVGGQWKPAWSPPVKLCFGPSIVVTPLNERDMPVHVFAGSSTANFEPKLEVDTVPGVYRLVWHSAFVTPDTSGAATGEPLRLEQRFSNRFVLDVPRP